MFLRKILTIFLCLTVVFASASAQSREGGNSLSTKSGRSERAKMIGKTLDPNSLPIEHKQYTDERVKELEKSMREREWGSEDTAWKRACELDTKEAYQKYSAMYPHGAHIAAACSKLIEIGVNEAFNADHSSLPKMNHVVSQDDSPTSTIIVENATGQPLTVMYSGTENKSVIINPGGKGVVTVKNGYYRIAASVPEAYVRPFAGDEVFSGGRYEVGFVIVRR